MPLVTVPTHSAHRAWPYQSKDGALLFLGSGDIGDVVVIPMEYHLCELDSIVVFFEYLMMFNGFHLPYFYPVIDIDKG